MNSKSVLVQSFVDFCEFDFEERMNHVCRKLIRKKDIEIITLSGPTCSGKTTLAKKLITKLSEKGFKAHIVSIDDYFKDRQDAEKKADMDSVNAIDLDLLGENIRRILNKKVLNMPGFDFLKGKRIGYRLVDPADFDIFIFEGIQAIYPEVVSLLESASYSSIFIDVGKEQTLTGIDFDCREIRFMRRLVRDFRFRGASAERTFDIWYNSVIPNEDKSIIPNIGNADIKIASYMPYELFVLKSSVVKVLSELPKGSEYSYIANNILEKISGLDSIDESYIPEHSLYREFIG